MRQRLKKNKPHSRIQHSPSFLEAASLEAASIKAASLEAASLEAASLEEASISLEEASIEAARAGEWRADPPHTSYHPPHHPPGTFIRGVFIPLLGLPGGHPPFQN